MASDGELPAERTEEELEARQEREVKELEERCRSHVDAARASNKGKKAKAAVDAAEREAEQWKYVLLEKHKDELDALARHLGQGASDAGGGSGDAEADDAKEKADVAKSAEDDDEERARRKKEKAQKKKNDRAAKESERQREIDRERLAAGPSARHLELAKLVKRLGACTPPMRVHEVAADGNCLYRSVGDQLRRVRPDLHKWARAPEFVHEEVRALCAASLRRHTEEYAPFAELAGGEDFEGYCGRVERSADWGGELELRALADGLGCTILVHRAEEDKPLVLGSAKSGAPLQVAYHRHYYSLGEHYNSVVPVEE